MVGKEEYYREVRMHGGQKRGRPKLVDISCEDSLDRLDIREDTSKIVLFFFVLIIAALKYQAICILF